MRLNSENSMRFENMVKDFVKDNNLFVSCSHDYDTNQSSLTFKLLETNQVKSYIVEWSLKKSLTDACTAIFTHLTREWNLDGGNITITALPTIKNVIYNEPATIILWDDGTKTVVKCQEGDTYSKETGFALCIAKKALGNKGNFNEVFKKWVPEEEYPIPVDTTPFCQEFKSEFERIVGETVEKIRRSCSNG